MTERRRPYICKVKVIERERRDTFREHVPDPRGQFRDIRGASEGFAGEAGDRVGSVAMYGVDLTDEGVLAFRRASNLHYIERDEIDSAPQPFFVAESASELDLGVEYEVLRYLELPEIGKRIYNRERVLAGVGDTGANAEARRYLGERLYAERGYIPGEGTDDGNGHGSWTLGAAMPSKSRAVNLKVLANNGSGYRSQILAGMLYFYDYCRASDLAGTLSLSLGGPGYSQAYEDAIATGLTKRVLTLCAAGNEAGPVSSPANCPSAVAVAAYDYRSKRIADFSNRGPEVDIAAPGVRITGIGGTLSGTSMATPLVSRIANGLMSAGFGPLEVRHALLSGAIDTQEPASKEGHGIANALRAFRRLPKS